MSRRGAVVGSSAHGNRHSPDRPRGSPQPGGASRRAAHPADDQRGGAGRRVRVLLVAEPRAAAPPQQTAADADSQAGRQGRGHGRPGGARAAGAAQTLGRHAGGARSAGAARQRRLSADARAASGPDRRDEGGRGEDPAQARRRQPGHARRGRAVHDHDHRVASVRAGDLAAADPVRAVRLRRARAQPAGETHREAAAVRGSRSCS